MAITRREEAAIKRIDELTKTARTSWFALLSYLAFVGVTLVGVKDADFFITERETALPLIGVSIPTFTFFWVAPVLGASLYVYFHVHLQKLWEAVAKVGPKVDFQPLSDHVSPWLVTDLGLNTYKGALRPRPMSGLALGATLLLAYAAGPIVLGYFWWRSMPAHEEWLTIIGCGIPFAVATYAMLMSWGYLRDRFKGRTRLLPKRRSRLSVFAVAVACLTVLGWLRTEGSFYHYARTHLDMTDVEIEGRWWSDASMDAFLAQANLAHVVFVETPTDWEPHDVAKNTYQKHWCSAAGLPASVCDWRREVSAEIANLRRKERGAWCLDLQIVLHDVQGNPCEDLFDALELDLVADWKHQRRRAIAKLPNRSLANRDLRKADLRGAHLEGAGLRAARLEGANLFQARLEGANLREARLIEANLSGTRMEAAKLRQARLMRANLSQVKMDGADFHGAQLEGANFQGARMEGASLFGSILQNTNFNNADLRGVDLAEAKLEGAEFFEALMHSARLGAKRAGAAGEETEYSDNDNQFLFSDNQLSTMYGDGAVTLPEKAIRPAHWPAFELGLGQFDDEWRKWQASPDTYIPPEPPE